MKKEHLHFGGRINLDKLTKDQLIERAEALEQYYENLPADVISEAWAEAQICRRLARERL